MALINLQTNCCLANENAYLPPFGEKAGSCVMSFVNASDDAIKIKLRSLEMGKSQHNWGMHSYGQIDFTFQGMALQTWPINQSIV